MYHHIDDLVIYQVSELIGVSYYFQGYIGSSVLVLLFLLAIVPTCRRSEKKQGFLTGQMAK